MNEKDELPIPDEAIKDQNSLEIVRVWVANKGQHISLRTGVWEDPAFWGVMLADLAGHIANAFHQEEGLDRTKALERIKAGLYAELGSPTDKPKGRIFR